MNGLSNHTHIHTEPGVLVHSQITSGFLKLRRSRCWPLAENKASKRPHYSIRKSSFTVYFIGVLFLLGRAFGAGRDFILSGLCGPLRAGFWEVFCRFFSCRFLNFWYSCTRVFCIFSFYFYLNIWFQFSNNTSIVLDKRSHKKYCINILKKWECMKNLANRYNIE